MYLTLCIDVFNSELYSAFPLQYVLMAAFTCVLSFSCLQRLEDKDIRVYVILLLTV